ncbi:unnamed protein product [Meloidogyne enterolobii]|uniref:Uncharacterized protein n=1 Tax=Meloidogyne enterolobii TaxID=390850 RepID=A0ACB1ARS6_MELEN
MIDESKGDFINLLSENEKIAEEKLKEYIGEAKTFGVKEEGKGKNVVMTPLKISENELEPQVKNLQSGHINQNQDDQSKGKGKEPIIIESDEEMEYTPKINEKNEDDKTDKEYLEIIPEPSGIINLDEYLGKPLTKTIEINEDEHEMHNEELQSGLNDQKHDDQSKGKGKINEEVESPKTYAGQLENLRKILEIKNSKDLGKLTKFTEDYPKTNCIVFKLV